MPVDVNAAVISNVRLSDDYNVLTLAAPEIGELTQPGQFVMVKADLPRDSLLRRPFSVFEVVRDGSRARAISIFNKRAGRNTRALYALEAGEHVAVLGPLGKPFTTTSEAGEAWMVAGGVGLAPFATLAESLAAAGTPTTLFYGARADRELFYLDFFERLGITLVLDRAARVGARKPVTTKRSDGLRLRPRADARGRRQAGGALRPAVPGLGRASHGMRPRRLL
jgi:dihydroorotate dehydrogenase electron transfer subunit